MRRWARLGLLGGWMVWTTGCATAPMFWRQTSDWPPPGGIEQTRRQDAYACERDVAYLPPTPQQPEFDVIAAAGNLAAVEGDRARAAGMFRRCMASKGYTLMRVVQRPTSDPAAARAASDACRTVALAAVPRGSAPIAQYFAVFDGCMAQRGYVLVPVR